MVSTVEFEIVQGDIRSFDADVVALKHAQAFFGADEAVANALSQAGEAKDSLRVKPGAYRYVETRGSVRAHHALFVGVPSILEFGYQDISEFAASVLSILSTEAPSTRHLATTIHGVGFGLDEVEALLSEFRGCVRGIQQTNAAPVDLERISVVERNSNRVERLKHVLGQRLAHAEYALRGESGWAIRRRMGHAALILDLEDVWGLPKAKPVEKPHAFVAMPFKKEMDDVFYYGIQGPVHAAGFLCERIDQEAFTGDILNQVRKKIEGAAIVIADLTDANPNVYLEVGYAWGKGRPTVLLVKDPQELRFDVRGQRCLTYARIKDLEESLAKELEELVTKGFVRL